MILLILGISFLVLLVTIVLLSKPITVYQGEAVVIEKYGKFDRILTPGMHFINPFFESVKEVNWTHKDSVGICTLKGYRIPYGKELLFDPEATGCITRDNVRVKPDILLYYKIVDVKKAVYDIDNLYEGIASLITTAMQKSVSQIDLKDYTKSGETIISSVRNRLNENLKWGVGIINVEIQQYGLPQGVIDVIQKSMIQEKEIEAKKKTTQAANDQAITKQENDRNFAKLQFVIEREKEQHNADIALQANKLQLQLKTEKEISEAESKAKAIKLVSDAEHYQMSKMFPDPKLAADYRVHKLHTDALSNLAKEAKVILVPYESTKYFGAHQFGLLNENK